MLKTKTIPENIDRKREYKEPIVPDVKKPDTSIIKKLNRYNRQELENSKKES